MWFDEDLDAWDLGWPLDLALTKAKWVSAEGDSPMDLRTIDPRIFTKSESVAVPGDVSNEVVVPLEHSGPPLDISFGPFMLPVVSERVASLIDGLAPGDVQRIPIHIGSISGLYEPGRYEILNAIARVDCINEAATDGTRWTSADGVPELVGRWKMIVKLVIDASKVADHQIFRIDGWEMGLIVTDEIRRALSGIGASGASYRPICSSPTPRLGRAALPASERSQKSRGEGQPRLRSPLTPRKAASHSWHMRVQAHCERFLGPSKAIGEIVPGGMPITLYDHAPSSERRWRTLRTGGVSERPMAGLDAMGRPRHVELLTYLPEMWDVHDEMLGDERWWPGRLLKQLGRFVHDQKTFFCPGHSVTVSEAGKVYTPTTPFAAAIFLRPWLEAEDFDDLEIDGVECHFLWVYPITEAEACLKRERGDEALVTLIRQSGLSHVIDPNRACLVTGRRPSGQG